MGRREGGGSSRGECGESRVGAISGGPRRTEEWGRAGAPGQLGLV